MKSLVAGPPMYREIVRRFPAAATDGVIFCWGDTIYNPSGIELSKDLVAHEGVHSRQQAGFGGPEPWWVRYLTEPAFVLEQELPAYRTQFAVFCQLHHNRSKRQRALVRFARDLSSPIYGSIVSFESALRQIRGR